MDPADLPEQLLPCLDFTQTRRVLRVVYVLGLTGAVAALAALAALRTDVVVVASAVVTPIGETARVQSAREATVDAILVREGDAVAHGQSLVRLDKRAVRARLEMLTAQARAMTVRVNMLEHLIESRAGSYHAQDALRVNDRAGIDARSLAVERLMDARELEKDIRARDENSMRRLVSQNAVAQKDMDSATIRAGEASAEAEAARASLREIRVSRSRLSLERMLLERDLAVASFADGAELAQARVELTRIQGDITAAQLEEAQLDIIAPRAGIVQGLAVLDRGDVVSAGSTLAYVVPSAQSISSHDGVVVKASVTTDGIAFIWPKQPVRIKLDAFPFQDFGVFHGYVERVARDTTTPLPNGPRGNTYDVRVVVTSAPRSGSDDAMTLRPGMIGQAEFTVRREPVLLALLRPLRGATESMRQ